jgi:hypothetical protein
MYSLLESADMHLVLKIQRDSIIDPAMEEKNFKLEGWLIEEQISGYRLHELKGNGCVSAPESGRRQYRHVS